MAKDKFGLPVILVGIAVLVLVGFVAYNYFIPFPEKEVEPKIVPVEKVPEPVVEEPEPEPEPVVEQPKVDPVQERFEKQMKQKGYEKIGEKEPSKYVEINDLLAKNVGYDEARLSSLTFTIRNLRAEDLFGEVVIDIYGNSKDKEDITYRTTYTFNGLPSKWKLTETLPIDHDVKQIKKDKMVKIYVYDRYVSPKKILGQAEFIFTPEDQMKTLELDWI